MKVIIDDQTRQIDNFIITHKGMDFNVGYGNASMWKDTPIENPNICRIEVMDTKELVWFLKSIDRTIKTFDYELAKKLHYELNF